MKAKKLMFVLLLVLVGFVVIRFVVIPWIEDAPARQIIHSFMDSEGMDIKPWTDEYEMFMRDIMWGAYPELTGNDSKFVTNHDELELIYDYAWKYSGYPELYGGYDGPDEKEAATPPTESNK